MESTTALDSTATDSGAPEDDGRDFDVAIIGGGMGGIAVAYYLRERGHTDFVVLEAADDVGGTWRDNSYPGCACDIPSHLYSFSFAPNPDWSSTFSGQPEIWDYIKRSTAELGLSDHVRLNHDVLDASWNDDRGRWAIETSQGLYSSRVLVSAAGLLSTPSTPEIPGLDDFRGPAFHSAQWDHEQDLDGRRVAAVGTGASAIQFIPALQPLVGQLDVFQRTPAWVLPRPDRPLTKLEHRMYRRFPLAQRTMREALYYGRDTLAVPFAHEPRLMGLVERAARWHVRRQVADPKLRKQLTPDYAIGCKRVLLSDDYYPALTQPNVELVTAPISRVCERSILTEDGAEREVDAIVFGTGFTASEPEFARRIRGLGGVTLSEVWDGSPEAYLGVSVADFPNMFLVLGPNTGLGHNSALDIIESCAAYIADAVTWMQTQAVGVVDVRADEQARYNAEIQRRLRRSVWQTGGCRSWYQDAKGRNTALWPGFAFRYRRTTAHFRPAAYATRPAAAQAERPGLTQGSGSPIEPPG